MKIFGKIFSIETKVSFLFLLFLLVVPNEVIFAHKKMKMKKQIFLKKETLLTQSSISPSSTSSVSVASESCSHHSIGPNPTSFMVP